MVCEAVSKLTRELTEFSETKYSLGSGILFHVRSSEAHRKHATSLLLRKVAVGSATSKSLVVAQSWTLTWIDPAGLSAYNYNKIKPCEPFDEYREEFGKEINELFNQIIDDRY